MRTSKEIFNEYGKRFRKIRKNKSISEYEIREAVQNATAGEIVSDNVRNNWAHAYRGIPPIGVLAAIAYTLGTSCSYLLGQHDIEDFAISEKEIKITMEDIKDLHKQIAGQSIHTVKGAVPNWINDRRKNGIQVTDHTLPYLKIADSLGIWLDYLLKLTDIEDQNDYVYRFREHLELIEGKILVFANNEENHAEYGIIVPGGKEVLSKTGEMVDLEEAIRQGAKLVKNITTY